jgi:hypothetical protein
MAVHDWSMRALPFLPRSLFLAGAILCSALMFWMQLHAGRAVLPVFGGGPSVWVVCLAFFQCALVLGYAVAHVIGSMPPPLRLGWHTLIMVGAWVSWPAGLPASGDAVSSPEFAVAHSLASGYLLPFLALATTSPLLQRWAFESDGRSPWPLYAWGNASAVALLLCYPFVLEPAAGLTSQAAMASWSFVVLSGLLVAGCLAGVAAGAPLPALLPETQAPVTREGRSPILLWLLLAAVPSALLSTTTHRMTADIAPVPFLWTIPLALYLLTWTLAFARHSSRKPAGDISDWSTIVAVGVVGLIPITGLFVGHAGDAVFAHLPLFVVAAYACHRAAAILAPHPSRLTVFYMVLGIGGAVGGLSVALVPNVLPVPAEHPLLLASVPLLLLRAASEAGLRTGIVRHAGLVVAGALLLAADLARFVPHLGGQGLVHVSRNFYGVLQIREQVQEFPDGERFLIRRLTHGATLHGFEILEGPYKGQPTAYYARGGAFDSIYGALPPGSGIRHMVVGLGTGTLACLQPQARWHFIEIDPDVVDMARDEARFTYLSRCSPDAVIRIGDGRKVLQGSEGTFGSIVFDAFTSDAVPVHLLTVEAVREAQARLNPDGLLVWHVSNRYLDLMPIVAAAARANGLEVLRRADLQPKPPAVQTMVVAAARPGAPVLARLRGDGWRDAPAYARPWTDDHASMATAMRPFLGF